MQGLHIASFDLCLGGSGVHLDHFATAFKQRALLNHQRGCLNVAIQFCGTAQLQTLGSDDVAINSAMDDGNRDFDVRIDLTVGAHDERSAARRDSS